MFDKDFAHDKALHERTGFVFEQADFPAVEYTLNRAIRLWYDYPDDWRHLLCNGMRFDYSWNHPGEHYSRMYDHIRHAW